jgi:hypothetical protein
VGQVQARRERKRGFQVPSEWLEMLWENKRVSARCVVFNCACSSLHPPVPRGWGLASPFIGQGGGELHARRATWLRVGARRATV